MLGLRPQCRADALAPTTRIDVHGVDLCDGFVGIIVPRGTQSQPTDNAAIDIGDKHRRVAGPQALSPEGFTVTDR